MKKGRKRLLAGIIKRRDNEPARVFNSLPKPPVHDGVCACGCCHVPDRGPCPEYHKGANERCAVCDHSRLCHRRKGEPPPKDWNAPLRLPVPRFDLLPPSAMKKCPACTVSLMRCPTCLQFIPLKSSEAGYHISKCPTCGYFDNECPRATHEKNTSDTSSNP